MNDIQTASMEDLREVGDPNRAVSQIELGTWEVEPTLRQNLTLASFGTRPRYPKSAVAQPIQHAIVTTAFDLVGINVWSAKTLRLGSEVVS